jgi:hypothetical protein
LGKEEEARPWRQKGERIREDSQLAFRLGQQLRGEKRHDPDLCYQLASVLLRLGYDGDALHFFHKVLAKNPNHQPTNEALADYYAKMGEAAKAAYHRRLALKR